MVYLVLFHHVYHGHHAPRLELRKVHVPTEALAVEFKFNIPQPKT